jgi:hypothetical protein
MENIPGKIAPPELEYVFSARVSGHLPPLDLGDTPYGRRRIFRIGHGEVYGPRLSGRVLEGGADWQFVRHDGVIEMWARYTIQADDGSLIMITNTGIRHAPQEILERLASGEPTDPSSYYMRATPVFEVDAGPHDWLMRNVFVARGERGADYALIHFFVVR